MKLWDVSIHPNLTQLAFLSQSTFQKFHTAKKCDIDDSISLSYETFDSLWHNNSVAVSERRLKKHRIVIITSQKLQIYRLHPNQG